MGKGILFFCCACFILVLTIVNLSIGPIISGRFSGSNVHINGGTNFNPTSDLGTLNCQAAKDDIDDYQGNDDEVKKNTVEYVYDACQRLKGMHDMEYTSFIFDIVIGFICGLLGILHIFEVKKDFVSNTGLIGLICGVIGFVFTLVYVIFNGLVYTTVYSDEYKKDGDYKFAEKSGSQMKCFYYEEKNPYAIYAKIKDLGKKQYNYDSDFSIALDGFGSCKESSPNYIASCAIQETFPGTSCDSFFYAHQETGIDNKDLSDRFLTSLILSLFVCLASIGLALFGFLLFRTPGDF